MEYEIQENQNLPQLGEDFNGRRKYIYASDLMELRERCGKLI